MLRNSLTVALLVSLAACGVNQAEFDALEARVEALEQQQTEEEANSPSARVLQESQGAGDVGDEEPSPTTTPIRSSDAVGLVAAADQAMAGASFLGVLDPEFGGTTIEGDENTVTILMVRAGLDDVRFAADLLRSLGFDDDSVGSFEGLGAGSGESADAQFSATWVGSPEQQELTIEAK